MPAGPSVVVVGAGAFGGWTALHLRRRGARVTLLDAFGPGNSRASSGGETRIIRALYPDRIYVRMTARALDLWREFQALRGLELLHRTGFLRFVSADDPLIERAPAFFAEAGMPLEVYTPGEASRRFPQVYFGGVDCVLLDPSAGWLPARRCCALVAETLIAEGGEYRETEATPGAIDGGAMHSVTLRDGSVLAADCFVFACGPWMGRVFPDAIGDRIRALRREVCFFGTPAGDRSFDGPGMPCWGDNIEHFYGVPGNEWRGFKVGEERLTIPFDPTSGDRTPSPEAHAEIRRYLAFRFPALGDAPLVESRVCQYESTADAHLIVDRHPRAANVLLAGGGSGHGFKLGPAVGELAAQMLLEGAAAPLDLSLSRPR
ncbi:MAG: NAD(P)/FAD-dependent oxidoreductase [Bryobacteraceae bacterium]